MMGKISRVSTFGICLFLRKLNGIATDNVIIHHSSICTVPQTLDFAEIVSLVASISCLLRAVCTAAENHTIQRPKTFLLVDVVLSRIELKHRESNCLTIIFFLTCRRSHVYPNGAIHCIGLVNSIVSPTII